MTTAGKPLWVVIHSLRLQVKEQSDGTIREHLDHSIVAISGSEQDTLPFCQSDPWMLLGGVAMPQRHGFWVGDFVRTGAEGVAIKQINNWRRITASELARLGAGCFEPDVVEYQGGQLRVAALIHEAQQLCKDSGFSLLALVQHEQGWEAFESNGPLFQYEQVQRFLADMRSGFQTRGQWLERAQKAGAPN